MPTSTLYELSGSDVFRSLETAPDGLASGEVQARLSLYGPNLLKEPPPVPIWRRAIGHLTHLMALLLWAAGLLAFATGEVMVGVVIWGVVLINAGFSFWQEYRAERAVAALKRVLPVTARVLRDGQEIKIPAGEIVPGDVLVLAEGDNIPADARVTEEYGLRLNQATLTGEAMPARKTADASLREGLSEVERPNLVFAGTSVVSGTGRAVVFTTGMLTQFGRIANLTQAAIDGPSPLQRSLDHLTKIISLVALGLGALVFLEGALDVGLPWIEAFLLAIGIIVAAVPEGLRPTVTLSLAMAVQRLAQRGVLVKKLSIMETLGTTSVICTDKSGTLTQNQMTVRHVWVAGQAFKVTGVGYEPSGQFSPAPHKSGVESDLENLMVAASLCNNARLTPPSPDHSQWACLGDQTEAALHVLAVKQGMNESAIAARFPRIHELPFDARRKRMSTIHRHNGQQMAFIKGAPKEVLQLCTHFLQHGEAHPLDDAMRAEIMAMNDRYARNAMRVLALARRTLPLRTGEYLPESVEQGLTFLGLAAMMDPPRPEVAAAIKTCREAGIRLVMITGDYGLTAESLARRVGMLAGPAPLIVTGSEVEAMTEAGLQEVMASEVIFARMAPEHKLRVVAAFQARGEVVAVTGDGVNDAPALRKADIGIAMGITGTDVAREAADVILMNDNFAAIVYAIEEGRAVYDNLRKFITYIFASNVPEVLPFIATALFRVPLALTVIQILVIDMVTDILPALALGTEKPEPNIMRRPPRGRNQPWLDTRLMLRAFLWLGGIESLLCFGGFFVVYAASGAIRGFDLLEVAWLPPFLIDALVTPARQGSVYLLATTVFHVGLVMAQVGNAFTCRTETGKVHHLGWFSNKFLLIGIFMEVVLIILINTLPPLASLFGHVPLTPVYWIGLGLYPFILYGLDRVRKSIARRAVVLRKPAVLGGITV
jgi:P-type Ca2+ transporter type 2C